MTVCPTHISAALYVLTRFGSRLARAFVENLMTIRAFWNLVTFRDVDDGVAGLAVKVTGIAGRLAGVSRHGHNLRLDFQGIE